MRFNNLAVWIAVLLVVSVAGACQDTVRVGIVAPLTGSQAAFGEALKNGYLIALDEINAKGGVLGKRIELDIYDDQSKPEQAVQGVSKLVDQDHVPILLGSFSSESTMAMIPAVTQHQVPLIIPIALADNLLESKSPWIFRVGASSADYARATVAFLKDHGAPN